MSQRARIDRNRRKRIHRAELMRHELDVAVGRAQAQAGVNRELSSTIGEDPVDRDAEERQWRMTWAQL